MNRPIFLIGYMCSGKSTLGRALACRLGWSFIDLDDEIETRCAKTVSEIFNESGESGFRRVESDVLRDVITNYGGQGTIVAVGGGTPCFGRNMELMNREGLTVRLEAPVERLVERLTIGGESRPLVAGKSADELTVFVNESLSARSPFYALASHSFDSSELEDEEMIERSVSRFIDQFIK